MKKLPVGISTFSKIIEEGYLYIDKTHLALDLINNHTHVFLSRPRRFGKSLFISMLQEIFEGNKKLFEGLFRSQPKVGNAYEYHKTNHLIIQRISSAFPNCKLGTIKESE